MTKEKRREKDNDDEGVIVKNHLSKLTTGISAISLPMPERLKKFTKERLRIYALTQYFPRH